MKNIFIENFLWMGWNLILSFVPVIISFLVFKKSFWQKSLFFRMILFFFVFLFYLFLPNSPYVLSDIIHLVRQIKDYKYFNLTDTEIILFLIPQFMFFMFLGFSFYVLAFQKMIHFLAECNFHMILIWLIKIINPVFMSIGIFLGRYYRFNTWDFFANYDAIIKSTLDEFSNFYFILFIILTSIVIFIGFEILSLFYKNIFTKLFEVKAV